MSLIGRLLAYRAAYDASFRDYDVLLTPVLSRHAVPIGYLSHSRPPADVVARITEEIRRCGAADELKAIWASNGAEFGALTPAQFGDFVGAEIKRWAGVVKASGAKLD